MSFRATLAPDSLNTVFYAVMIWCVLVVVLTRIYDTPLIRLEVVVGTGILLIWVIWAIRYRLEQIQQGRYNRYR